MGRPKTQKWERETQRGPLGRCEPCGKQSFTNKKAAKDAAKRAHGTSGHLNAYPCPWTEGRFHYGNMPAMVRRGEAPRSSLLPNTSRG